MISEIVNFRFSDMVGFWVAKKHRKGGPTPKIFFRCFWPAKIGKVTRSHAEIYNDKKMASEKAKEGASEAPPR